MACPLRCNGTMAFSGFSFTPRPATPSEADGSWPTFFNMAQRIRPKFEIGAFKDRLVAETREVVAGRPVVCGVSGGVDSTGACSLAS